MVAPGHDAPASPFREIRSGTRIGGFEIVRRLARGGMAEVYLARDTDGRPLALKLILPHLAGDPAFVAMFEREVRIAARLVHPNIARVLAVGRLRDEPYLAMEYVAGPTIRDVLRRGAEQQVRMPLAAALATVIQACDGLEHAHGLRDEHGVALEIVHRDVSPSNLMIDGDGVVKLLDFGIAKAANQTSATSTGMLKGKPGYMSPEQCADEPVDRRTDVFNLGILLYELTVGRRLFFADNPMALLNRITSCSFAPPSTLEPGYPAALERIVGRALAREPDDRHPTAAALAADLVAFAQAAALEATPAVLSAFVGELFEDAATTAWARREGDDVAVASDPGDARTRSAMAPTGSGSTRIRRGGRRLWPVAAALGVSLAVGLAWRLRAAEGVPAIDARAAADGSAAETIAPSVVSVPATAAIAAPVPIVVVGAPPAASTPPPRPPASKPRPRRRASRAADKSSSRRRSGPAGMYP